MSMRTNASGWPAGQPSSSFAAPQGADAQRAQPETLDETLSSTTPDLPKKAKTLQPIGTLGWSLGIGAGFGALALRSKGAGWGMAALGSGASKGALVGAGIGAALLGLDKLTGGQVKKQLDYVSLDRRHQILFVLKHPTNPWVAGTGLQVAKNAQATQDSLYGRWDPLDGPQDAFRHTYAAGLFALRSMRDHGETPATAHALAIEAGEAHEADGQDNNDDFSRGMDTANNLTGTLVLGDGRALPGEAADADGFITEQALRDRVLRAMFAGHLQVVDRMGATPTPRPTNAGDLPGVAAPTPVMQPAH
ncbi:MAG: hypothetical protein JWL76_540 [Thermoleophilia bacterium]|nr:hypothetical protein [Thermoleophilia bacterium]